ncbi:MAG: ECF transporter S component [Austwickia sp.]|nr:ECF transporter S component [Austwickia sp.]
MLTRLTRGDRDQPRGAHLVGSIVLVLVTALGLVAFAWPFFASADVVREHGQDAPYLFALLIGLLGLNVLAEQSAGGLDAKRVAMLGVVAALGGALRVLSAGTAGLEPVFVVVILAGRVLGRRTAFLAGALALLVGAFLTGGVGPWTAFQMIATGWTALGAALLPPVRHPRLEVAMLAGYGLLAGLAYGLVMNLWFWPFVAMGTTPGGGSAFVPGADPATNLAHYGVFYVTTSLGWDLPRGVLSAALIALAGRRLLAALRRAVRRAHFDTEGVFLPVSPASGAAGRSDPARSSR